MENRGKIANRTLLVTFFALLAISFVYWYQVVVSPSYIAQPADQTNGDTLAAVQSSRPAKPKTPTGVIATTVSTNQINITWEDVSNETGYIVQRAPAMTGPWYQITVPGTNVISYSNIGLLPSTTYYYRVSSYNSRGSSSYSAVASATTQSLPCGYTIAPTSSSFEAASTVGSIGVNADSGCNWTGASNVSWVSITSGISGTGNGTVRYSVEANNSTSSRSGILIVAGETFTVTQSGAPCSYSISPTSSSFEAVGVNDSVNVTASPSTCPWTSVSNASWISITSGISGTGNGIVSYLVHANGGTSSRTGTLTVAGETFTVTQSGAPCSYSISPTSSSFEAIGSVGSVGVTSGSGCNWTSVSNASWISITSGSSGTGNGTVGYSVQANTTSTTRTGTLTIANKTFTITQTGIIPVAQGQLQWVKTMLAPSNSGSANVTGIATDGTGNVVAAGYFYGTVNFGTGPIVALSQSDGFIVKYSVQGNILWVKHIANATIKSVDVDSQGNVIVAGSFVDTIDLTGNGTGQVGVSRWASAGNSDIFLARYSSAGVHDWSKRFGGTSQDSGNAVAVDGGDNIMMAVQFSSISVDFGGTPLIRVGNDGAVVKLSGTNGTALWAMHIKSPDSLKPQGLAVDRSGDVVVTGYFFTSIDLGNGSMGSAGANDIFLAKYSGINGNYMWGKKIGGLGGDSGVGITTDPDTGNVIVTGGFTGVVNFGGGLSGSTGGVFIAGYDASGNYLWVKTPSGGADFGASVKVKGGYLAFTGRAGSLYFGSGTSALYGNGQPNYCVAIFTLSGNLPPVYRWAKIMGPATIGASAGAGIDFDSSDHLLTAGSFQLTADFDGLTIISPAGSDAGFVTQYTK